MASFSVAGAEPLARPDQDMSRFATGLRTHMCGALRVTEVEQAAMAFHAKPEHPSYAVLPSGQLQPRSFLTNGAPPVAGAPFFEPCMDDRQKRLTSSAGGDVQVTVEKDINTVAPEDVARRVLTLIQENLG